MRAIPITYNYDGPDEQWQASPPTVIAAIGPAIAGKFTRQVAVADDGAGRVHWGCRGSDETLKAMQSQAYSKTFAAGLKDLIGQAPNTVAATVSNRTTGW